MATNNVDLGISCSPASIGTAGMNASSPHCNHDMVTPNLRSLAAEGTVLNRHCKWPWHTIHFNVSSSSQSPKRRGQLTQRTQLAVVHTLADVYRYCSPTRCSALSGRLPIHVNEMNYNNDNPGGGMYDLCLATRCPAPAHALSRCAPAWAAPS